MILVVFAVNPSHSLSDLASIGLYAITPDHGHSAAISVCCLLLKRRVFSPADSGKRLLRPLAEGLFLLRGVDVGEAKFDGFFIHQNGHGVAVSDADNAVGMGR